MAKKTASKKSSAKKRTTGKRGYSVRTKNPVHTPVHMRGFYRVQITEDKNGKETIVGDSGWKENQVTNIGIRDYLVNHLLGDTGNRTNVTHMALGTGGAPASNDTSLSGELTHAANDRKTVSTSVVSSRTAQFTAAFNSVDSFLTATANISNIGLFATSTTAAGTLFAGNTYASSAVATNQNVNATYQIRFASA